MDIIYNEGTESEVPAFLAYFRISTPLLFPQYSPNMLGYLIDVDYSPDWLSERLRKKAKKVYLAKQKGNIVGYLLVSRPNAGIAFGDWLAVDKQFQKKGIASQLLSMWEKDVLSYGGHNIYLWTYEHNIAFYEKRGFVRGGFLPKGWGGEDAYLMYKIIAEPKEENYLRHYLQKIRKA